MILTAKHRRRTLRLLTVALILIGLTAALAACKQPVLTSITSGLTQACGLKQDGTPVCWGVRTLNYYTPDRTGRRGQTHRRGEKFTAISAGRSAHLRHQDRTAPYICWGYNKAYDQTTVPEGVLILRDQRQPILLYMWHQAQTEHLSAGDTMNTIRPNPSPEETFHAISNRRSTMCAPLAEDGSASLLGR